MKNFVSNVTFGTNKSIDTFASVYDLTTSSKEVQISAYGRQFPLRATKDQMLKRIDEQLAAMEAWKGNLATLKAQVILEDFLANQNVYKQFLSEEQLKALGVGIITASGSEIPDAEIVEEKDK